MRSLFMVVVLLVGCKAGTTCTTDKNCAAGLFCVNKTCAAPSCADKVRNGEESDVDCGGGCSGCASGLLCTTGADCASKTCTGGLCGGASCSDGVKNGSETEIDCGGSECAKCVNTAACALASDCASGICQSSVCVSGGCTDGIKNGAETDIDCGGADCAKCADSKACSAASDCVDGVCVTNSCAAPTCSDGVKNQNESDVDCGAVCPAKGCEVGKVCVDHNDCASTHCVNSKCVACEAPIDCGVGTACLTYSCDSNACAPHPSPAGTVVDATKNGDCMKTVCTGNPDGSAIAAEDAADPPQDTSATDCQTPVCNGVGTHNFICVQSQVAVDANQCITDSCNCSNNTVVSTPATSQAARTSGSCNAGGGVVCSSSNTTTPLVANCVHCNDNSQCTQPFETCGGAPNHDAHLCGCTTASNPCAGKVCGNVNIGCGQSQSCGACGTDHSCSADQSSCNCSQPACNEPNQCGSYTVSNSCTTRVCPANCSAPHHCCSGICCAQACTSNHCPDN